MCVGLTIPPTNWERRVGGWMNSAVCNGGAWRGRRGRRAVQPGGAEVKGATFLHIEACWRPRVWGWLRKPEGTEGTGVGGSPGPDRVGLAKGGREGGLNESRAGAGLRPPARGGAHPGPLRGPQPRAARFSLRPRPACHGGAPLAAPLPDPPRPPPRPPRPRAARPPAPPSPRPRCFPPAPVSDPFSFVKIRSPDRSRGHGAQLLYGSPSRILAARLWRSCRRFLQARGGARPFARPPQESRGLVGGVEAVDRAKVGVGNPGSGSICPGPQPVRPRPVLPTPQPHRGSDLSFLNLLTQCLCRS